MCVCVRLGRRLGVGTTSEYFECVSLASSKACAVKVLRLDPSKASTCQFMSVLTSLQSVSHSHIAAINAWFYDATSPQVRTPYILTHCYALPRTFFLVYSVC